MHFKNLKTTVTSAIRDNQNTNCIKNGQIDQTTMMQENEILCVMPFKPFDFKATSIRVYLWQVRTNES